MFTHTRNRPTRIVAGVTAMVASLALLAACGGGGGGDKASASGDLELWTFLDPNAADDPRGKALNAIVQGFNKSQTEHTVKVRNINYAKIDSEVIRATASGQGPDIINVYSTQLATHVDANTLMPLDEVGGDYIKEISDDLVFPIDGVTFDGSVMSIPWEVRGWMLWYRQDLLDQAGLELPTTLDELGTVAAALSEKTDVKTGLAIGFSDQGLGADFVEKFIPLTWVFGGEILDANGDAVFADEAGVKTLEYLTSLREVGAFGDEVLSMAADDVVQGFSAGTIGMAIEGTQRVSAARGGEGIGENLQVVPAPSNEAGTPLPTAVAGQTMGIGANTKNAEGAMAFIEYYTALDAQTKFAQAGVLPARSTVYDSEGFAELSNAKELQGWRDYIKEHGRAEVSSSRFNQLSAALVIAGQSTVFQGADPLEALDTAATTFSTGK